MPAWWSEELTGIWRLLEGLVERWHPGAGALLPWWGLTTLGATGAYLAGRYAAGQVLSWLWRRRARSRQLRRGDKFVGALLRGQVSASRWEQLRDRLEADWRRAGAPGGIWVILTVHASLATAGAAMGVALRNPILAALLAVAGGWLPQQILRWALASEQRAARAGLLRAVHVFAVEFQESGHVARSLVQAGRRIRGSVGSILEDAGRRLAAGEQPGVVLRELGDALAGHPHGRLFAQLCWLANNDSAMAPLFHGLVVRMHHRELLERRVKSAYSGLRGMVALLNVLAAPALVAGIYAVPGGLEVYTETLAGRVVVLVAAAVVLFGFQFNSRLGRRDLEGV